jgi:hypothetical protein
MEEAHGMHVLHSVNELEHKGADMLRLQGSLLHLYGLEQIPVGTEFQDEVDVALRLEVADKVDNIRMGPEAFVAKHLLRAFIDSERWLATFGGGAWLEQPLDSNTYAGDRISSHEHLSVGAAVQASFNLIAAVEQAPDDILMARLHRVAAMGMGGAREAEEVEGGFRKRATR